jgi:hypothetical protein
VNGRAGVKGRELEREIAIVITGGGYGKGGRGKEGGEGGGTSLVHATRFHGRWELERARR